MKSAIQMTLNLIVILLIAVAATAQESQPVSSTVTTPAEATSTATAAGPATAGEGEPAAATTDSSGETSPTPNSWQTRSRFTELLRQHPSQLPTILALDPGLLSNDTFLSGYPEVARFVEEHPEIRRNAHFYVGEFRARRQSSVLEEVMEPLTVLGVVIFIAFALAWVIRTIVEQKRWNRLSRSQSDVHNKILDRFNTSEELLEYVKSPAGAKFLESAPIPVRTEPVAVAGSPFTRIIWSVQLGVVVAAGAIGMLLVSLRLEDEAARELFALGMIAFCVGAGFIASAAVSIYMSRRLGIGNGALPPERFDDPGVVR